MNETQQIFIAQGKAPSQTDRLIQVLHEANGDIRAEFKKLKTIARFKKKYDLLPNGCWQWKGALDKDGYGAFYARESDKGLKGKRWVIKAHRYSYILSKGQISSSICVLHKCDNPACVNPAHLFVGTHHDNVSDKVSKNRQPKGETIGTSKLNNNNVRMIKRLCKLGSRRQDLAKRFNVCVHTITNIVNGTNWKHIV